MSKFSGQNDFYDFIENYGGFNKFLKDTGGIIYCGKQRIVFSQPIDILKYYPHKIANSWEEEDMLVVKILSKSCLDCMFSDAAKEYFEWKLSEEAKRLETIDE
jgi:hypothetical protein